MYMYNFAFLFLGVFFLPQDSLLLPSVSQASHHPKQDLRPSYRRDHQHITGKHHHLLLFFPFFSLPRRLFLLCSADHPLLLESPSSSTSAQAELLTSCVSLLSFPPPILCTIICLFQPNQHRSLPCSAISAPPPPLTASPVCLPPLPSPLFILSRPMPQLSSSC